ncbi:MAG: TetR family transcriptional regulator [Acidimicrobiia bacterium]|nr:MAG: TetR family transcriptional regulator [Acidimicrobiia bacterium]
MSPRGRRPGRSDTRERILAAARRVFGEVGYERATIRRIAGAAGVDPALVHHYFGPKADLYAAAISLPVSPREVAKAIADPGLEGIGERVTRLFFGIWERPEARRPLLAMLRGALEGEDTGVEAFRQFLEEELLGRVAPLLDSPDRYLRVSLAAAHLVGVAVARYVVRLGPIASADLEELVELVAPRVGSYFDQTLGSLNPDRSMT